jgi:hypothetical protein
MRTLRWARGTSTGAPLAAFLTVWLDSAGATSSVALVSAGRGCGFLEFPDACAAAQLALTFLIFLTTIFILGFIADPVIALCMDPWGSIFSIFNWGSRLGDDSDYYGFDRVENDKSWATHFTMGFASLGMLSVAKTMLTSPIQIWIRSSGRRGTTGRDRLSNLSWMMILIGAATFVYVRSQSTLTAVGVS